MNYLVPFRPAKVHLPARSDEECARILNNYRPSYYTVVGPVTAQLHGLTRLHNGQVGAFYDVKLRDPLTAQYQSTRYLYGVDRFGAPKELKKLSTVVR